MVNSLLQRTTRSLYSLSFFPRSQRSCAISIIPQYYKNEEKKKIKLGSMLFFYILVQTFSLSLIWTYLLLCKLHKGIGNKFFQLLCSSPKMNISSFLLFFTIEVFFSMWKFDIFFVNIFFWYEFTYSVNVKD